MSVNNVLVATLGGGRQKRRGRGLATLPHMLMAQDKSTTVTFIQLEYYTCEEVLSCCTLILIVTM